MLVVKAYERMPLANSQIDDMGWPGGQNGKALASTTRRPVTPCTRARESTTAEVSFLGPILPRWGGGKCQSQLYFRLCCTAR